MQLSINISNPLSLPCLEYLFPENDQVWVQVVSPSHKIFFEPVKESKEKTKAEVKTEVKKKSKAQNTKKG